MPLGKPLCQTPVDTKLDRGLMIPGELAVQLPVAWAGLGQPVITP